MMMPSNQLFEKLLQDYSIAYDLELKTEHKFHPERKWRFDYAIIRAQKVAIEYEGTGGRHHTVIGYTKDCEKYNEAQLLGWKVYRFTCIDLKKCNIGKTCEILKRIFESFK